MSPSGAGSAALLIQDVRIVRGRPPAARLLLDVVVANHADESRWALLPEQLPADEGGVFAVETLQAATDPSVVIARILGRGGRVAVRLAPHARVRLRDIGLTWWGASPTRLELPLELVRSVRIDRRSLDSWLAADATAVGDGTDATLGGALTLDSRFTEGLVSLPLELDGEVERTSAAFEMPSAG